MIKTWLSFHTTQLQRRRIKDTSKVPKVGRHAPRMVSTDTAFILQEEKKAPILYWGLFINGGMDASSQNRAETVQAPHWTVSGMAFVEITRSLFFFWDIWPKSYNCCLFVSFHFSYKDIPLPAMARGNRLMLESFLDSHLQV